MQIRRGKPPGSGRLARTGVELSREARVRLAWMDFYGRCCNVAHAPPADLVCSSRRKGFAVAVGSFHVGAKTSWRFYCAVRIVLASGISRQTFYRWQRRYDPYDLTTLEERSHYMPSL